VAAGGWWLVVGRGGGVVVVVVVVVVAESGKWQVGVMAGLETGDGRTWGWKFNGGDGNWYTINPVDYPIGHWMPWPLVVGSWQCSCVLLVALLLLAIVHDGGHGGWWAWAWAWALDGIWNY
jgi:hypothetical protein